MSPAGESNPLPLGNRAGRCAVAILTDRHRLKTNKYLCMKSDDFMIYAKTLIFQTIYNEGYSSAKRLQNLFTSSSAMSARRHGVKFSSRSTRYTAPGKPYRAQSTATPASSSASV